MFEKIIQAYKNVETFDHVLLIEQVLRQNRNIRTPEKKTHEQSEE